MLYGRWIKKKSYPNHHHKSSSNYQIQSRSPEVHDVPRPNHTDPHRKNFSHTSSHKEHPRQDSNRHKKNTCTLSSSPVLSSTCNKYYHHHFTISYIVAHSLTFYTFLTRPFLCIHLYNNHISLPSLHV